jgi:Uma2 family endonuclease
LGFLVPILPFSGYYEMVEYKQKYTLAEYFHLSAKSEERLEYCDGEIFAMAGGAPTAERSFLGASNLPRSRNTF